MEVVFVNQHSGGEVLLRNVSFTPNECKCNVYTVCKYSVLYTVCKYRVYTVQVCAA